MCIAKRVAVVLLFALVLLNGTVLAQAPPIFQQPLEARAINYIYKDGYVFKDLNKNGTPYETAQYINLIQPDLLSSETVRGWEMH